MRAKHYQRRATRRMAGRWCKSLPTLISLSCSNGPAAFSCHSSTSFEIDPSYRCRPYAKTNSPASSGTVIFILGTILFLFPRRKEEKKMEPSVSMLMGSSSSSSTWEARINWFSLPVTAVSFIPVQFTHPFQDSGQRTGEEGMANVHRECLKPSKGDILIWPCEKIAKRGKWSRIYSVI